MGKSLIDMRKVYVLEDDNNYFEKEKKFIKDILGDVQIVSTYQQADLYILDIEGEINGIDLAFKIKKDFKNPLIVFLSSHNELIFDAQKTIPYFFARKDHAEDFRYILKKIADQWYEKKITATYEGEPVELPLSKIILLEKQGSYILIHTDQSVYKKRTSLRTMIKDLNDDFISINKSEIINVNHVMHLEKDQLMLSNQAVVYISRTKRKQVILRVLTAREELL